MFERKLTKKEATLIAKIVEFIRDKHSEGEGHDYSHVLEVTKHSIEIAEHIEEKINPFVLICGALFHDIGRVNAVSGSLHGLEGAGIAEEFLEASGVGKGDIKKITRIVTRHTPTSMIPPETLEEKIVSDADRLECLGRIGVLRGIMGKKGSIEDIVEKVIAKRLKGYDILHFEKSREMGKKAYEETLTFINGLKKALSDRCKDIEKIEFPR